MPRGPVVATPPPGTTPKSPGDIIQSAVWNAAIDDVYNIFNTPQPVEYGGTGADNYIDAANNLGLTYVQIGTRQSFTNASSVSWTDLGAYENIYIEFSALGLSNTNVGLQASTNNGSSWISGAGDYAYRGNFSNSTSIVANDIAVANRYPVVGASISEIIDARIHINRFNKSARKRITSKAFFFDTSNSQDSIADNSGYTVGSGLNAVRLIATTGAWTGNATLWGRRG